MKNPFFTKDGHIARWVFYPPAWGGGDYWCDGFSDDEKTVLFNHMKQCHVCREAEIEATLQWAELQPRDKCHGMIRNTPSNTSQNDPAVELTFDKYPPYLLDHIMRFSKGTIITFDRDKKGRVTKITGVIDGELESETRFIYDGGTTTIHCYCHNCQDDSVSTQEIIFFADFHIDHSKKSFISYSFDATEFYPECKEIKRYHTYHKAYTDDNGNLVKILLDNKPWYIAEYDECNRLRKQIHGPISTEYRYSNGQLVHKKSINNNEIIEDIILEYAENEPGPVRIFDNKKSCLHLKALHSYSTAVNERIPLVVEADGIPRYHFNSSGNLITKIHLPNNTEQLRGDDILPHFHDFPEKFETLELVLVDHSSGNMRIIKKKQGNTIFDQTSFFKNGLIKKVCNQADAKHCTVSSLHFINRHWTELIELDTNLL